MSMMVMRESITIVFFIFSQQQKYLPILTFTVTVRWGIKSFVMASLYWIALKLIEQGALDKHQITM